MATTNLNIKTDILRTSIHEHGIPFALKLDIPNEITIAAIEEGRKLMADSSATRYWILLGRYWKYKETCECHIEP